VALPVNDTNLETEFSAGDYTTVSLKDNSRVAQTADGEFAIFLFKEYSGGGSSCTIEWEGQTNYPPSLSTVYLEIFNRNTSEWEQLDSDNATNEDTDFTLNGSIADLTNYKDGNTIISCRVYQEGV
jgi:hypothetical protein